MTPHSFLSRSAARAPAVQSICIVLASKPVQRVWPFVVQANSGDGARAEARSTRTGGAASVVEVVA